VQSIIRHCIDGDIDTAVDEMVGLWALGYSAVDVVTTVFKVVKTLEGISEAVKLDFIQQISASHMRVADGVGTLLQMKGLCARIAAVARAANTPINAGTMR
jgi:replication factor C subunit 2/4